MSDMYIVCGPIGSGKTTFAKKFAEDKCLLFYSIDDCYRLVNGSDKIRKNLFESWMLLFSAVHTAELNDLGCVVDVGGIEKVEREQFLLMFTLCRRHLIFINASLEQCLENNQRRERHAPEEKIRKRYSEMQLPERGEPCGWDSVSMYENTGNVLTLLWHEEKEAVLLQWKINI